MKFIYSLALTAVFLSCNTEVKKEKSKTTEIFSYYLETAFGDSIPQENHLYILVPELGCKGCREGALQVLHNEIIRTGKKDITYIFSPKVHFNDSLTAPCETLTDSSLLIDKINLPVTNIAFIKTTNGNVVSLNSIRSETTDSIAVYLGN